MPLKACSCARRDHPQTRCATMKPQMKEPDQDKLGWLPQDSAMPNVIEHWRQQQRNQQMRGVLSGSAQVSAALSVNIVTSVHVSDAATAQDVIATRPGVC